LQDTYSEKDLENAILAELESFMLEFGRDFTFVGRQVRITIGKRDYYIDLLFYHRKMNIIKAKKLRLELFFVLKKLMRQWNFLNLIKVVYM